MDHKDVLGHDAKGISWWSECKRELWETFLIHDYDKQKHPFEAIYCSRIQQQL